MKVLITGTGRSGTSFLVQILTLQGINTGFKDYITDFHQGHRAGMEIGVGNIESMQADQIVKSFNRGPAVIKSPDWSLYLKRMFKHGLKLDYCIIPVRDFKEVMKSVRETGRFLPRRKMHDLYKKLSLTIEACVTNDVPIIFLNFHKMIESPKYLYNKLSDMFTLDYGQLIKNYKKLEKLYKK